MHIVIVNVLTAMPPVMSRRVENITELERADHIKWKRLLGYDHHSIVERVDVEHGVVHVIEYGSDKGGSFCCKGVVKRSKIDGVESMHRYMYDECDEPDVVIQRAEEKLNKRNQCDDDNQVLESANMFQRITTWCMRNWKWYSRKISSKFRELIAKYAEVNEHGEREYNPFTNNCEHFATWCKTGTKHCSQVHSFKVRVGTSTAETASGGLAAAIGRCLTECASVAAKNETSLLNEATNFVTCGGPTCVLKRARDALISGGIRVGYNRMNILCGVAITVTVVVVTELCLFRYNYLNAQKNYKDAIQQIETDEKKQKLYYKYMIQQATTDEMKQKLQNEAAIQQAKTDEKKQLRKEHRNNEIKEAACKAVAAAALASLCAVGGSFIQVLGTAIGAAFGGIVGHMLGRWVGGWLLR